MSLISIITLLVVGCFSASQAQVCRFLARDGECVSANLPCQPGKEISPIFNCGTHELNCCYTPDPPPTPPAPSCGRRSRSLRILNGGDAGDACKWPWMVSIRIKININEPLSLSNTKNLCNGVLVKQDRVLTSANCLHIASILNNQQPASSNLLVVAGEYDTEQLDISGPIPREEFHRVQSATIHPRNFQPRETMVLINDLISNTTDRESFNIAVLKLQTKVNLGNCRELACVPSAADVTDIPQSGFLTKPARIASWGISSNSQNPSVTLKDARIELYPSWFCNIIQHRDFNTLGTTCGRVVFGDVGICQGDDGGMVMYEDLQANQWKLYGLIDFPFYETCMPSGSNLLTFTDLRNPLVLNWVNIMIN